MLFKLFDFYASRKVQPEKNLNKYTTNLIDKMLNIHKWDQPNGLKMFNRRRRRRKKRITREEWVENVKNIAVCLNFFNQQNKRSG